MRVKPASPDVIVRYPHSRQPLPAEGADVPEDNYWIRRLRSGDVVPADGSEPNPAHLDPVAPLTTRAGWVPKKDLP